MRFWTLQYAENVVHIDTVAFCLELQSGDLSAPQTCVPTLGTVSALCINPLAGAPLAPAPWRLRLRLC